MFQPPGEKERNWPKDEQCRCCGIEERWVVMEEVARIGPIPVRKVGGGGQGRPDHQHGEG